jgi:hypothetical protein
MRINGQTPIRRPPATVFDFVADERNNYDPTITAVELLTPEPIGVGTRFRCTSTRRSRPVEMIVEIIEYDRPHRLAPPPAWPAWTSPAAYGSTQNATPPACSGRPTFRPMGCCDCSPRHWPCSGAVRRGPSGLAPNGPSRPIRPRQPNERAAVSDVDAVVTDAGFVAGGVPKRCPRARPTGARPRPERRRGRASPASSAFLVAIAEGDERTHVGANVRDAAIAKNIVWILERDDRVVIAAATGRVQRRPYSAPPVVTDPLTTVGQHLAASLGDDLIVIGSTFGGGRIRLHQPHPGCTNPIPTTRRATADRSSATPAHMTRPASKRCSPPPVSPLPARPAHRAHHRSRRGALRSSDVDDERPTHATRRPTPRIRRRHPIDQISPWHTSIAITE